MRFIDDFICITKDKQVAVEFYQRMTLGFPEYNAFIQPHKTLLNFQLNEISGVDMDADMKTVSNRKQTDTDKSSLLFPWCGLYIHSKDLSVHYQQPRNNEKQTCKL